MACSIPRWALESALEAAGEGTELSSRGGGGEVALGALPPISCPAPLPFPQAPQLLIPTGTRGRITKDLSDGQYLVLWNVSGLSNCQLCQESACTLLCGM